MQMELSYVFAVVITGLVVVFLGLVLLIAFISIIGKIFQSIDRRKKPEAPPEQKATAPAVKQTRESASDGDEIIAVISAAVAAMGEADGKAYRVKSVRRARDNGASANAWAAAGLRESTMPF